MWKVIVKKDGKVIRTRHFSTKRKAEKYEEENTFRNPIGAMCDFEILEYTRECEVLG